MGRLRLDKIEKLKKYLSKFEKCNIKFFDELENLNVCELKNKLGTGFTDTLKISNVIDNVKLEQFVFDTNDTKLIESTNNVDADVNELFYPLIKDLGLSVRSTNALIKSGYNSLKDIIDFDFPRLMNIKNLGSKSAYEILEQIDKFKKNELIIKSDIDDYNIESVFTDIKVLPRIKITRELLDNRTFNALQKNCIYYIDELVMINLNEFKHKDYVGDKIIEEIKTCISQYQNTYFYKFDEPEDTFLTPIFKFDKNELISENLNLNVEAKNLLYNFGYVTLDDLLNKNLEIDLFTDDIHLKLLIEKFVAMLNQIHKIDFIPDLNSLDNKINAFKFKNLKISRFEFLNIYFKTLSTIEDVENYTLLELFNFVKKSNNIDFVYEFYTVYKRYIDMYPFDITINISNEKFDICRLRENYTLEEIGKKYDKTRERIRQIVCKEHKKITEYAENNLMKVLFLEDACTRNINNTLLSDDSYNKWFDLLYLFSNFEKITNSGEVIYFRKSVIEKYQVILSKLKIEINKNGYVLIDEVDYVPNDIIFNHLIKKTNIKKSKLAYYIDDTTNKKVVSYIKHNGIIDLSEGNLTNIMGELEQLLDVSDFDKHNVTTRLLDYGCCPIGDGSYTLLDKLPKIDDAMYELIREHIKVNKIIYCESFLYSYKELFDKEYNPSLLYFKLKERFKGEFFYSKGSLAISVIDKPSKANLVYTKLNSSESPVDCSRLYSDFELTSTGLSNICAQNEDIIKFDKTTYWCLSKIHIDSCKESIIRYIKKNKIFKSIDLYYYISFDFDKILKENFIVNLEIFTNVINNMFKEELMQYDYDIKNQKYVYKEVENKTKIYDDFDF